MILLKKTLNLAFHLVEIVITGRKSLSLLEERYLYQQSSKQYPILFSSSLKSMSPEKWKSDSEFLQVFDFF